MTAEQTQIAHQLLREGLDWIGMTELTEEEEEKATQVQARIERLLEDVEGAPAGKPVSLEDHHRVVLSTREHHRRCLEEKDECRLRMDKSLNHPEQQTREYQRAMIRRFQVAYQQWEAAERAMTNAEAGYGRALWEALQ